MAQIKSITDRRLTNQCDPAGPFIFNKEESGTNSDSVVIFVKKFYKTENIGHIEINNIQVEKWLIIIITIGFIKFSLLHLFSVATY